MLRFLRTEFAIGGFTQRQSDLKLSAKELKHEQMAHDSRNEVTDARRPQDKYEGLNGTSTSDRVKSNSRIPSLDVLRGVVMILMALDHTRDFFTNQNIDLMDPSHLSLPYFFTRWITHLCAPTFVFLAGVGAYMQLARGQSKGAVSRFLAIRGCWLIFLELTVVYFVWIGMPGVSILQVIWAIGVSMVFLSGLVWLPIPVVAAIGVIFVAGHNALDGIHAASLGHWSGLWMIGHESGFVNFHGRPILYILYPIVPWNGLMALGFCFGRLWISPTAQRIRWSAGLGAGFVALFSILRAFHGYGDPNTWTSQHGIAPAITTFLNVEKYPPSLQYICITMGLSLLLLAWFESLISSGRAPWLRSTAEVYGRVPLAYYVLHVGLIHLLTIITCALTGHDWHRFTTPLPYGSVALGTPQGYGFSLPIIYLIWIGIVASLYWPMKRYANYKRTHPENKWLSYL